jgi:nitrogen fixation protein FixH
MKREFTGRDMAFLTVAFFAVVVSVNVLMAFIASGSWSGLVVQNSYVASQHFNEKTAELERSVAMGVHASISYRDGEVHVTFRESSGKAVRAGKASLRIGRPSFDGEDRILQLDCTSGRACRAATQLDPGIWAGEVNAELLVLGPWTRAVRLFVKEGDPA